MTLCRNTVHLNKLCNPPRRTDGNYTGLPELEPAGAGKCRQADHRQRPATVSRRLAGVGRGRAGSTLRRRLLELLVQQTDNRLLPPQIVTESELPELLYEPQRLFASPFVQQWCWAEAVRGLSDDTARRLMPQPPDASQFDAWLDLGQLLWRVHRELAAEGLSFADLLRRGKDIVGVREQPRWEALREAQQRYLGMLDAAGLWDRETARIVALDEGECQTTRPIMLIGTVDLNKVTRAMLDQVAEHVTACIPAPPELAERFDEHGCVIPDVWQSVQVDIPEDRIHVVDGPREQADAVVRALLSFDGRYRPDEIIIGTADERLVPRLRRTLARFDVPTRWAVGKSLQDTLLFRMLRAIGDYVDDASPANFLALVRHPDIAEWINHRDIEGDWLTELDDYLAERLPHRLGHWLGSRSHTFTLRRIHGLVNRLVADLQADPQHLAAWSQPILRLIKRLLGDRDFDPQTPAHKAEIEACDQLQETLAAHASIPANLMPLVTAPQAIDLTLQQLTGEAVAPAADDDAIELLGWLELPLDDAPACIVTSLNEGFVPSSVSVDQFLPDVLRRQLGVLDNSRRYARDAFALSLLVHSRPDVVLISGRRDERGDPLVPSRLLFATDPQICAQRVVRFLSRSAPQTRLVSAGPFSSTRDDSDFIVPRPERLSSTFEKIRTTDLRAYLESPYRFYLERVLQLRTVDDAADEISGGSFGDLAHAVLKEFGLSELSGSSNSAQIREFLIDALHQQIGRRFGDDPLPVVRIQEVQLSARLAAFSEWQVRWVDQGWSIRHIEAPDYGTLIEFPLGEGQAIPLQGASTASIGTSLTGAGRSSTTKPAKREIPLRKPIAPRMDGATCSFRCIG